MSNKTPLAQTIFILGLPRSGTTLLYQFLISSYRLAYFNNTSNFFFTSPILASFISLKIFGYYKPKNYKSRYGVATGINSPSESGFVFRNWFDDGMIDNLQIKQSINTLSSVFNAPFITKNLYNDFRIEQLNKIFPNAVFIEIKRDVNYIAQSLLIARKTTTGDYKGWFGLKPIDYHSIVTIEEPFEQVAEQIKSIEISITNGLNKIPSKRKISISYQELCKDSISIQNQLTTFFLLNNINLKKINNNNIPIVSSDSIKLSKKEWNKLIKYLE